MGYIDTPIHRDSVEFGFTVSSDAESIEDAVGALTRAALDDPPLRDITTTRTGRLTSAVSRFAPRCIVDRVLLGQMRKNLRGRTFDDTSHSVAEFAHRLTAGSGGP